MKVVHSLPKIGVPTRDSKIVHSLLSEELSKRWDNFDPDRLKFSTTMRTDIQTCGYVSLMWFVYLGKTRDDGIVTWLDIPVGFELPRKGIKKPWALYRESDAAQYSVWESKT